MLKGEVMSYRNLFGLCALLFAGAALAMSPADELSLKAQQLSQAQPAVVQSLAKDAENYSGNNSGGTAWNRPFANGTCCSGLGPVLFSTQPFFLSAADTCSINSVQTGFDGYIFVYQAPFDPANQTVNFVAGDDDGNGGIGTSDIDAVALSANTSYILVTTGFANGDVGPFTNTISCPTADVSLGIFIPAPVVIPSMNLFGLALLGLLLLGVATLVRSRLH